MFAERKKEMVNSMALKTEPILVLDKSGIRWSELTDDELKKVWSECCICGKMIFTYKALALDSICSKRCANKLQRRC